MQYGFKARDDHFRAQTIEDGQLHTDSPFMLLLPFRIRYFLKLPPGGADVRSCRGWGRGAARGGRYVACAARIDGPRARDYHRSLAPLPRRPRRLPAGRLRSIATHMHTTVLSIFLRLSVTSIVVVVVFEWLDAVRY